MEAGRGLFAFVQAEFGFLLGPPDGRYVLRDEAAGDVRHVLVLGTLGAPERRRLRGRRGATVQEAGPSPVPTSRATVVRPERFADALAADDWLAALRDDPASADAEVGAAFAALNRALHAHRTARADPYARDVSPAGTLALRIGHGSGDAVAEGRFREAWELPPGGLSRPRRSMEAPDERFAAILGGRERPLPAEELLLRARSDLDAGRAREAALQARVALEGLIAELPADAPGGHAAKLRGARDPVGAAANRALQAELGEAEASGLAEAVALMEAALRAWRLRGG